MLPNDIEHLSHLLDKNAKFQRGEGQVTGFSMQKEEGEVQVADDGSKPSDVSVPVVSLPPTLIDQQLQLPAPSMAKKALSSAAQEELGARPRGNEVWSQKELQKMFAAGYGNKVAITTANAAGSTAVLDAAADNVKGKEEPVYTVLEQQRITTEDVYLGVDFTRHPGGGADGIVVKVQLPKVEKTADIQIRVEGFQLYVSSKDYYLNAALPQKCVSDKADAAWDDKKKELLVKLVVEEVAPV